MVRGAAGHAEDGDGGERQRHQSWLQPVWLLHGADFIEEVACGFHNWVFRLVCLVCCFGERHVRRFVSRKVAVFLAVPNAESFLGELDNSDDEQNDHQDADHGPNPHPSARPSMRVIPAIHPSVIVVHNREP